MEERYEPLPPDYAIFPLKKTHSGCWWRIGLWEGAAIHSTQTGEPGWCWKNISQRSRGSLHVAGQGLCRLQGRTWLDGGYHFSPDGFIVMVHYWGGGPDCPSAGEGERGSRGEVPRKRGPRQKPQGTTDRPDDQTHGLNLSPSAFIDGNQDQAASSV